MKYSYSIVLLSLINSCYCAQSSPQNIQVLQTIGAILQFRTDNRSRNPQDIIKNSEGLETVSEQLHSLAHHKGTPGPLGNIVSWYFPSLSDESSPLDKSLLREEITEHPQKCIDLIGAIRKSWSGRTKLSSILTNPTTYMSLFDEVVTNQTALIQQTTENDIALINQQGYNTATRLLTRIFAPAFAGLTRDSIHYANTKVFNLQSLEPHKDAVTTMLHSIQEIYCTRRELETMTRGKTEFPLEILNTITTSLGNLQHHYDSLSRQEHILAAHSNANIIYAVRCLLVAALPSWIKHPMPYDLLSDNVPD